MLENSSLSTLESISHYTNATVSTAIDGRVGGEAYTRDGTAYLELAAFVCIDVVGLVGNGFVLGVVLLCKEMQTVANFFVVSLSVADILVSALVTPIVTATRWKRMWLLGAAACDLQAIINHTCLFASLFNLAAIAVSRLVVTRRPGRYHSLFSTNYCCLYISIIWCFSIVYSLLPVMGWGEFRYDAKRYNCIFSSPQQGDLRLSGHDAGGGARTRDRRLPIDLRGDTLAAEPPTSRNERGGEREGE
ncbi:melatonin-related receptor [Plakobranchus ocellatus]|uniref:Melatonin-related receptor n=1 Tax=Plakobranchus ocellatus TaxID=259542 RepID=A0AAV3ZXW7_9GAST|nr:melatonin-related receptor [Plakobranchus ocellatus]